MSDLPALNEDFSDLLRALTEAGVDFLVVGAHALAHHGVVRATGDLDVLVRPSSANALRVIDGLKRFGAPASARQPPPKGSAAVASAPPSVPGSRRCRA